MYWLTKEGVTTTEVTSARAEANNKAKEKQSTKAVLMFMVGC
jgi:hypothetical protein